MEVVSPGCPVENVPGCRLDLHKKSTAALVLWAEAKGNGRQAKRRLRDLHSRSIAAGRLAWGLRRSPCSHGLRGSGPEPMGNVLAEQFRLLLANAQHIKPAPGRKTDHGGSEWIARLLQRLASRKVPASATDDVSIGTSLGIG